MCDFGLCKYNFTPGETTYTFCGSSEYMAPEMLLLEGHDYLLDYYNLGSLLYEFVTGLPPYYSANKN